MEIWRMERGYIGSRAVRSFYRSPTHRNRHQKEAEEGREARGYIWMMNNVSGPWLVSLLILKQTKQQVIG